MQLAIIVLGCVCLCLLGISGWLMVTKSQLSVSLAMAHSERDAAIHRRDEVVATMDATASKLDTAEREVARVQTELASLRARIEEREQSFARDREQFHSQINDRLRELAEQALDASSKRLLTLASESFEKNRQQAAHDFQQREQSINKLVAPINETLQKTGKTLSEIEAARQQSFAALQERITLLSEGGKALNEETRKLVHALSKPQIRGHWGEVTLRRVVELAGMREHVDFLEQDSTARDDGSRQRPDLIVKLPNDRTVVVDAKANIAPYLDAIDEPDPDRQSQLLDKFAKGILDEAKRLAKRDYAKSDAVTPDFVVMFVPGDQFLDAAMQREPKLLDLAADQQIILASPSSLIGLLRAVHVGWREQALSDRAETLFTLGRELHERAGVLLEHMQKVGTHLGRAVGAYNDLSSSAERRLLVTLRHFEDAGAKSSKVLTEPKQLDLQPAPPLLSPGETRT